MRRTILPRCGAAGLVLLALAEWAPASSAEFSREQLAGLLAGTGPEHPADLAGRALDGLDLSRLDFAGAVAPAAFGFRADRVAFPPIALLILPHLQIGLRQPSTAPHHHRTL